MKQNRNLGVYGLLIENNKVLLIKKVNGPYKGQLDLPGGSIEFQEEVVTALKREFLEETGLIIDEYKLFEVNSVSFQMKIEGENIAFHHIGIFYKILNYHGSIQKEIELDFQNEDSIGAEFYEINKLEKKNLSKIAILELEQIGFKLK